MKPRQTLEDSTQQELKQKETEIDGVCVGGGGRKGKENQKG